MEGKSKYPGDGQKGAKKQMEMNGLTLEAVQELTRQGKTKSVCQAPENALFAGIFPAPPHSFLLLSD